MEIEESIGNNDINFPEVEIFPIDKLTKSAIDQVVIDTEIESEIEVVKDFRIRIIPTRYNLNPFHKYDMNKQKKQIFKKRRKKAK
jgi:hypothetical protein